MTTPSDVRDWAESYRKAWEGADAGAAAALFSEDASYRDNIFEEPNRSRDGIVAYWSGATSEQSDIRVRMGEPIVDGARAHIEFWTNMTAGGTPLTLAGCLLLTFDDGGLCTDLREYWNVAEASHEPPPGWGS